jgi:hypothetical protein
MAKPPPQYLTLETLRKLFDPPRVFYLVAVNEAIQRGEHHEIQELLEGARAVKTQHGDLDKLIAKLEVAAKKAQG